MIRVVFDTNVLVSALLQPLGPPAQLILLALNGSIRLCITGNRNLKHFPPSWLETHVVSPRWLLDHLSRSTSAEENV